jgi:Protein of unknown function (DUF2911)
MSMRRLLSVSALLASTSIPALAQQGGMTMAAPPAGQMSAQPSPRASATMAVATGVRGAAPLKIMVDYGQPYARGRVVEGALIPNGTVWRTGANAATAFTTDVNLRFGALMVPKGSYTLFTMRAANGSMQLIINKQTGQWGTEYKPDMDLGRVPMTARTLTDTMDAFVIAIEPGTGTGAALGGTLRMMWGKTAVAAPFTIVP